MQYLTSFLIHLAPILNPWKRSKHTKWSLSLQSLIMRECPRVHAVTGDLSGGCTQRCANTSWSRPGLRKISAVDAPSLKLLA